MAQAHDKLHFWEHDAYTKVMEWARIQKDVISENSHDFGGTEAIKFGIDVK